MYFLMGCCFEKRRAAKVNKPKNKSRKPPRLNWGCSWSNSITLKGFAAGLYYFYPKKQRSDFQGVCPFSQKKINRIRLYLSRIKLVNFKNYASESFEFSDKLNCIVGLNGVGKTNLLDAIYYLCMCKSRFAGNDRNVVRQAAEEQPEFFRLEGQFERAGVSDTVVAKVKPGSLKEFERNGAAYDRLIDHIGQFPVVFIVPDDAGLLLEGSESRRMLMDNVLSQLSQAYLIRLITYNRLLQQRNTALKQFAEKGGFDKALILAYNEQMIEPANYIFEQRKSFAEAFHPLLSHFYKTISGNRELVDCTYHSTLHEGDFAGQLEHTIEKDRLLARTSCGIHKDDLGFGMNGFPLKRFASQGQLKSFVISVKLAQYEFLRRGKGTQPLLLLDDVFDKLDDHRVSQLLELLHGADFGQIFLTDTHENRAEEIIRSFSERFRKFLIQNGQTIDSISTHFQMQKKGEPLENDSPSGNIH